MQPSTDTKKKTFLKTLFDQSLMVARHIVADADEYFSELQASAKDEETAMLAFMELTPEYIAAYNAYCAALDAQ